MYIFVGFYHRKGTSRKTNNDYDFFQCSFLQDYPSGNSDCEGQEAITVSVNPDIFYKNDMATKIGFGCNLYFTQYGRISDIIFK